MCFESVVLVPGWTALSRGVPVRAVRLLTLSGSGGLAHQLGVYRALVRPIRR